MNMVLVERFIQLSLLIAAIIHLLPVVGLAGSDSIQRLYGIAAPDPNTLLLLRHRALLFALVAVPLLVAILQPGWRLPAMTGALVSIVSFLVLATMVPTLTPALRRVALVDLLPLLMLLPALLLSWRALPTPLR